MSFFKKRNSLLKSNVALNPDEDQDALIERLKCRIASLETQIADLQSANIKLRNQLNNIFSIARRNTIEPTQPVPSEDASVEIQKKNEEKPTTEVTIVELKPVIASKPPLVKEKPPFKNVPEKEDESSSVKPVLVKFFNDLDAQKNVTKACSSPANPPLGKPPIDEPPIDEPPVEDLSVEDYFSDSSFDSTSDPNNQPSPAPVPPTTPRPNNGSKNISTLYDKILQQKSANLPSQSNKYSYATTDPTQESEGTPSTPIMPGGAAPGTPSSKVKEKPATPRNKVVVALYPFKAIETGDLSLEKGAEYEVVDDSQEHWWKVKDEKGSVGYIPSNYVKEKELLGLQKYEWYVGDMSRQRAETLLKQEDKEGCFVVRNSSTKGMYTLSLYTKVPHPHSKHYHIKNNSRGDFYLSDKHCCGSVAELVNYHKHNAGGLCSRLKTSPCDRPAPPTAGLSHDKWEIDPSELVLHEELGSGQFGVVRRGIWRGTMDTAVKMMKEGTMSEDDFIEEAKVMTKLQHQNLVQLYGVCSKHRPIFIVTEYMKHGSLLNYLRRHENTLSGNTGMLLDMCVQVCKGMAYLERHNYIHRDLAARNCLVGWENVVKVADFGLARYVLDDQYTSSGGTKFPIKWAPPEVLNYTRFSSKSDIWAYGVLMWEVFTCGKMPYGRLKNSDVVERVQRGIVLEKPKFCVKEAYDVMRKCWAHNPEDRPSFRTLKEQLMTISEGLLAD